VSRRHFTALCPVPRGGPDPSRGTADSRKKKLVEKAGRGVPEFPGELVGAGALGGRLGGVLLLRRLDERRKKMTTN